MNNLNVIVLSIPGQTLGQGEEVITCPKCNSAALMTPYFRTMIKNLEERKQSYDLRCFMCSMVNLPKRSMSTSPIEYLIYKSQIPYLEFYNKYLSTRQKIHPKPLKKINRNLFDSL